MQGIGKAVVGLCWDLATMTGYAEMENRAQ